LERLQILTVIQPPSKPILLPPMARFTVGRGHSDVPVRHASDPAAAAAKDD